VAKRRATISAPIPPYRRPRSKWRRDIWANVIAAADEAGVRYEPKDSYEVVVLLYWSTTKRHAIHDVDNRLKDILDALQGRFGSSRSSRRLIENDNRVCRVVMEKQMLPKLLRRHESGGKIMLRPYRRHRWPLQPTKGHAPFKREKQ